MINGQRTPGIVSWRVAASDHQSVSPSDESPRTPPASLGGWLEAEGAHRRKHTMNVHSGNQARLVLARLKDCKSFDDLDRELVCLIGRQEEALRRSQQGDATICSYFLNGALGALLDTDPDHGRLATVLAQIEASVAIDLEADGVAV
jgi:hypothetical protein